MLHRRSVVGELHNKIVTKSSNSLLVTSRGEGERTLSTILAQHEIKMNFIVNY